MSDRKASELDINRSMNAAILRAAGRLPREAGGQVSGLDGGRGRGVDRPETDMNVLIAAAAGRVRLKGLRATNGVRT